MIPLHPIKNMIAASLFLGGLNVQAAEILAAKDWVLSEVSSGTDQLCVMSSKDSSIFRSEVYYLEIVKAKNKLESPVEVFVRVDNNKRANTGFVASVKGSSSQISFPALSKDKYENFWGIAKNLSTFVDQLKAAKEDVQIQGVGGKKEGDFSISGKGFAKVLAEMEKRCNNGTSIVQVPFEKDFLEAAPSSLDPQKISSQINQELRQIYFAVYPVHLKMQETQKALSQLIARYQPQIDELSRVRSQLRQIQSVDLPTSQSTLAKAQKQQVDAKADIERLTALIPELAQKVQVAQKIYDEARAILAPLEAEYGNITGRLSDAQSALSQARSRLSAIDSRLSEINQQISSLDSEADSIERSLFHERRSLDVAREDLRSAERERSAYNVALEKDRRLRNTDHSRLVSQLRDADSDLDRAEGVLRQVRAEKERAVRALEQCRATPGSDCSKFEEAVRAADSQIAEADRARTNAQNQKRQIQSRISDIEDQVDREVRREFDRLVEREQRARDQYESMEDQVRRHESRLSDIRVTEVPRLEREQSQLASERPGVISRINSSEDNVESISRELQSFKDRTDWDRKASAVERTGQHLRAQQNALAMAQSQKKAAEKSLEDGKATEGQMKALIEKLKAQVVSLNQRAETLERAIAPLATERAPLDKQISDLQASIAQYQNEFLNRIR